MPDDVLQGSEPDGSGPQIIGKRNCTIPYYDCFIIEPDCRLVIYY